MSRKPNRAAKADDEIPTLRQTTRQSVADLLSTHVKRQKGTTFQETVEFFDVEQRGEEWRQLHIGVLTASRFQRARRPTNGGDKKTRDDLMDRMAGEVLSGEPMEDYQNDYMRRGVEMEAEAREDFAFTCRDPLTQCGFARRTLRPGDPYKPPLYVGCSPDSLIGVFGVLEIKTMAPHLMIAMCKRGTFPAEHRAQCQGSLWVLGRDEGVLQFYYRGFPVKPSFKFERDDAYIAGLREEVEVFDYEMRKVVEQVRNMGRG